MFDGQQRRTEGAGPAGKGARTELRVIVLVLGAWALAIFGSQGLIWFLVHNDRYRSLADFTFFNLPVPFWLTGQFLPLWFIVLCVIFNIWMDRHSARNLNRTLRFRLRNDPQGRE